MRSFTKIGNMHRRIKRACLDYVPLVIKNYVLSRLPFLYPVFEILPTSSTIMITERCNLRCIMCKDWREPGKEELSTADWIKIIVDLKRSGIKSIHFTGGEPLLRKDIGELISHCSQQRLAAGFTTNGTLLTKEKLDEFIDAGLRSIAISMDAFGEKYDEIRGVPGSFGKTEKAVSVIAEARRKRNIDASINFTLMKKNIRELKSVKKLADAHALPLAICLLDKTPFIFALEENKNDFWISEDRDFEELREAIAFLKNEKIKNPASVITNFPALAFIERYFKDPRQKSIPCVSSQDRVIIDPYGNLLGGCMSMGTFGSLKDRSLSNLRKEKKHKIAKKNMFYKNCPGCSCGYLFNIRCFPPLIISDLVARVR